MASSNPTPLKSDPYEDRRLFPRVGVALPASIQVDGIRHSVQLIDVSSGGAKLNGAPKLVTGTRLTLDCGGLCRVGIVRWQDGALIGLMFESQVDSRDVAALADRSRALGALMKSRE